MAYVHLLLHKAILVLLDGGGKKSREGDSQGDSSVIRNSHTSLHTGQPLLHGCPHSTGNDAS